MVCAHKRVLSTIDIAHFLLVTFAGYVFLVVIVCVLRVRVRVRVLRMDSLRSLIPSSNTQSEILLRFDLLLQQFSPLNYTGSTLGSENNTSFTFAQRVITARNALFEMLSDWQPSQVIESKQKQKWIEILAAEFITRVSGMAHMSKELLQVIWDIKSNAKLATILIRLDLWALFNQNSDLTIALSSASKEKAMDLLDMVRNKLMSEVSLTPQDWVSIGQQVKANQVFTQHKSFLQFMSAETSQLQQQQQQQQHSSRKDINVSKSSTQKATTSQQIMKKTTDSSDHSQAQTQTQAQTQAQTQTSAVSHISKSIKPASTSSTVSTIPTASVKTHKASSQVSKASKVTPVVDPDMDEILNLFK